MYNTSLQQLMKTKLIFVLAILLQHLSGLAQKTTESPKNQLIIIAQANQGNSYITFPTDIGNISPLWFEGNLIPNFYIRQSQNSRLIGVLTPQIIIRMYQEESFPIRTPSYMPQITLHYFLKKGKNQHASSMYGRLTHHSNGQDGPFFQEDGSLNLKSGDFATNFFELGFISTLFNSRLNAYKFFKTSFEIHPKEMIQKELHGIYSRYRWHNTFSVFKLPAVESQSVKKKPTFSIKGETTWMFGNYNSLKNISSDRLNLRFTFYYHPSFFEDIGLFAQFYHGSDYYNMQFDQILNVLRFGIMTEKLRF